MPEPKPPVGEALLFMQRVWELVHALDVKSKRMMRELGVTGPQRLVIRIVGQTPGQTASDIATTLGKHPSTLTGVLARLEERDLIVRSADAEDRRRARFHLTAAGKKIDALRRGTVEAATRRLLARAEAGAIASTLSTVDMLVEELARD